MMKPQRFLIILSLLIMVSACAYVPQQGKTQLVAEPNAVDLMLADAADRATRALETLSAMEQQQMPTKQAAIVPNAPAELQRAVSFDWTGPVEPLIQDLARKSGYEYGEIGNKPPLPVTVTIRAVNKPLIDVFRDIGIQMGARADLALNAQARTVEIQYADMVNKVE